MPRPMLDAPPVTTAVRCLKSIRKGFSAGASVDAQRLAAPVLPWAAKLAMPESMALDSWR